jgi:HEPN domain-containing protein
MKEKAELVRGWLRKAQSDEVALDVTLCARALDVACFHAQQAAEKYLKAFLTYHEAPFPYTHNLSKLVELCAQIDSDFRSLVPQVEP